MWNEKHPNYINERNAKRKKELIDLLGGKCQKCGYDKCTAALDFHHVNSNDKEKKYKVKKSREWRLYKKEIEQNIKEGKVILLCSNCHREIHHDN